MGTPSQTTPALPRHPRLPQILEQNWQAEMTGHYTYRTLAEREPDSGRKQALESMATAEKEHAALWAARLQELGEPQPVYRGRQTGDADSLKNRIGGDDLALRRLEIDESRDIAKYSQQLKELGDAPSLAILNRVIEDEQEHYRELSSLIRRYPPRSGVRAPEADPKTLLAQMLTKRNQGRAHTAGWIGDAIYGVNDGLGSIFGIVSGVSGATLGNSKYCSQALPA
jgi:rubrerythrin